MATFAPPSNIVRRYVPNDHECLFTAIAYLCEGSRHGNCGQRLRAICAEKIAADPDMYSEAVLGKPNVQYVEWIKNPFNWGGELEIGILAQHFQVEVAGTFYVEQKVPHLYLQYRNAAREVELQCQWRSQTGSNGQCH